jgi:mRNA interferase MazF
MTINPKRGEIWLVNLDPTVGAEIKKTRPALVISSDFIGKLPLKLVIPITDWKPTFTTNLWHVRLAPSPQNGLTKPSAADTLQTRGIDTRRFIRKLSTLTTSDLQELAAAIVGIIEHQETRDS